MNEFKDKSAASSSNPTDLTEKEKAILIKIILICQVVCGTQYLNVTSFFPLFVKTNYGDDVISTTMVSICMCCFELAGVLCSPIHSKTISVIGRKNALTIGFIIMFLSAIGLGLISLIPYTEWRTFYYTACFTRFM